MEKCVVIVVTVLTQSIGDLFFPLTTKKNLYWLKLITSQYVKATCAISHRCTKYQTTRNTLRKYTRHVPVDAVSVNSCGGIKLRFVRAPDCPWTQHTAATFHPGPSSAVWRYCRCATFSQSDQRFQMEHFTSLRLIMTHFLHLFSSAGLNFVTLNCCWKKKKSRSP